MCMQTTCARVFTIMDPAPCRHAGCAFACMGLAKPLGKIQKCQGFQRATNDTKPTQIGGNTGKLLKPLARKLNILKGTACTHLQMQPTRCLERPLNQLGLLALGPGRLRHPAGTVPEAKAQEYGIRHSSAPW